jgi:hypothetical protein
MPLVSVPAIYDGKQVRLLEGAPVHGTCRVLVTFVAPTDEQTQAVTEDTRQDQLWNPQRRWQDIVEQTFRTALADEEYRDPSAVLSTAEIRLRMGEYLPFEEKLSDLIVALREE